MFTASQTEVFQTKTVMGDGMTDVEILANTVRTYLNEFNQRNGQTRLEANRALDELERIAKPLGMAKKPE